METLGFEAYRILLFKSFTVLFALMSQSLLMSLSANNPQDTTNLSAQYLAMILTCRTHIYRSLELQWRVMSLHELTCPYQIMEPKDQCWFGCCLENPGSECSAGAMPSARRSGLLGASRIGAAALGLLSTMTQTDWGALVHGVRP